MHKRLIFISVLALAGALIACSPVGVNTEASVSGSNNSGASSGSNNSSSGAAVSTQVDTAKLAAFESEFKTVATTPKGSVKCLFKALATLEDDLELGKAMLTIVFDSRKITEDSSSPTGFKLGNSELFLVDQIVKKPQIVHSYIGGSVAANYADHDKVNLPLSFPAEDTVVSGLKVDNSAEVEGATEGRVYVQSNGKDIPTPINMAKNSSSLWKVTPTSISSIATGVKTATNNDF